MVVHVVRRLMRKSPELCVMNFLHERYEIVLLLGNVKIFTYLKINEPKERVRKDKLHLTRKGAVLNDSLKFLIVCVS